MECVDSGSIDIFIWNVYKFLKIVCHLTDLSYNASFSQYRSCSLIERKLTEMEKNPFIVNNLNVKLWLMWNLKRMVTYGN